MLLSFSTLSAQEALRPSSGVVNGRRYANGYFGFSYRFPEGWNGNASSPAADSGASRFFGLFTANPMSSGGANELRYISIQADDLSRTPGVKNGHDFLASSLTGMTGPQGAFVALRQQKAVFGGKQFYRQDMKSKPSPGAPAFYQTQLVTVQRNFALTFSFVAGNTDDLEELVRSAESLNFFEPGSMPLATTPQAEVAKDAPPIAPAAPAYQASTQPMVEQPHESVMVVSVGRSKKSSAPAQQEPATEPNSKPEPVTDAASLPPAAPPAKVEIKPAPAQVAAATTPSASASPAHSAATPQPKPSPIIAFKSIPAPAIAAPASPASANPATSTPATVKTVEPVKIANAGGLAQPLYASAVQPEPAPAEMQSQQSKSAPAAAPRAAIANVPVSSFAAATSEPSAAGIPRAAAEPVAVMKSATPVRIRISPVTFESYIAHKSAVAYPALAKASRVEGEVLLRVVVGPDGNLHEVSPVSGPLMLRQGAVEAVKQWQFRPYVVDGQATEVESQVLLNFRLSH